MNYEKQDYCLQETHFINIHIALKWRDGKKYHINTNQKKAQAPVLTWDQTTKLGKLPGIKRVVT